MNLFLKRSLMACMAVGASLNLAACDTTSTAATIAADVATVRSITQQVCAFVPTISSVTGILSVFVPSASAGVDIANQVASSICAAASKSGARRGAAAGGPVGYVQGVAVYGAYKMGGARRHR